MTRLCGTRAVCLEGAGPGADGAGEAGVARAGSRGSRNTCCDCCHFDSAKLKLDRQSATTAAATKPMSAPIERKII